MRTDTLDDFLWHLAARVPAPGGGSTAALHLAQAAALIGMVARYSDSSRDAGHGGTVVDIRTRADALRTTGITLIQLDETAVEAGRVPAGVIRGAEQVVELAERLAPLGNPDVLTGIGAAADAVRAAASTARLNGEVILAGIDDPLARLDLGEALAGVDDLLRRADAVTEDVRERIR